MQWKFGWMLYKLATYSWTQALRNLVPATILCQHCPLMAFQSPNPAAFALPLSVSLSLPSSFSWHKTFLFLPTISPTVFSVSSGPFSSFQVLSGDKPEGFILCPLLVGPLSASMIHYTSSFSIPVPGCLPLD